MRRRRNGMAKAAVGVVLVAGASGAILWWNSGGRFTAASPEMAAADALRADAPAEPVREVATSTPAALLTPSAPVTPVPPASQTPVVAVAEVPTATIDSQGVAPGLVGRRDGGVVPMPGAPAVELVAPRPITASSPEALREGTSLHEAGRLIEARQRVNSALLRGEFADEADAAAAKQLLRQINQVLVFSPQRIAGDEWVDSVTIRPGDRLTRIANEFFVPYEFLLRINGIADARRIRAGQTIKVIKGPIHAVVDKRRFTMDLFLGSAGGPDAVYLTTFRVGLGSNDSTPTGLWRVTPENKLKNPTYFSPRGEGVIHADDPMNPLGEFWIGLTGIEGGAVGKLSYGIHGTIEPDSIGKMESMGCIRLLNEHVEQVFQMLFEGRSTVRVIE